MSFWESMGFQSRKRETSKKPHETIRERRAARNADIAELERQYEEQYAADVAAADAREAAARASEAAATTVANAAARGLLTARKSKRGKFSSTLVPRTAPRTLVVVPDVSPNNAAATKAAATKAAEEADRQFAAGIRDIVESETMAERKGQIEAIERQIDSGTLTKRDVKRLEEAKEDLEEYVVSTRKFLKEKRGVVDPKLLYPEAKNFEGEFDPIRNGNGPIEHYVFLGSSRKPQTGIGKAVGDWGLNRGDSLRDAFKMIPTFLIALVIIGAALAAAIGTGNVYLWIVVIILLTAGIGGVIWKRIV